MFPVLHSQQYSPLLKAFTSQGLSELTLLLKIQEYCYDNIHFMKAFQKIVVLLYKGRLFVLFSLWRKCSLYSGRLFFVNDARWPEIIAKSLSCLMSPTCLKTSVFRAPADSFVQLAACWVVFVFINLLIYPFFFFLLADVLSEEAILKWYNEGHVTKGKSVFLEQMKKFVEWLKNAEEGKHLTVSFCSVFVSR